MKVMLYSKVVIQCCTYEHANMSSAHSFYMPQQAVCDIITIVPSCTKTCKSCFEMHAHISTSLVPPLPSSHSVWLVLSCLMNVADMAFYMQPSQSTNRSLNLLPSPRVRTFSFFPSSGLHFVTVGFTCPNDRTMWGGHNHVSDLTLAFWQHVWVRETERVKAILHRQGVKIT